MVKKLLLKLLLTKEEQKKLDLKELQCSAGHAAYSWKIGSPTNCTCEACFRTWSLENSYITIADFIDFLDNPQWEFKYKK